MIDDLLDFLSELSNLCKGVADTLIDYFVESDNDEEAPGPDYVKKVVRDVIVPSFVIGMFKVFVSRTGLGHVFPHIYKGVV